MNADQIVKTQEKLHSAKSNWLNLWQECADYGIPNKNDILRSTVEGEKKGITLYDTTAILAGDLLAGALHGMLTNPTTTWFDLTTGDYELDQDDVVRKFLDSTAKKIHVRINQTNFQTEIHETYIDEIFFGTAAMSVLEDDKNFFRFSTHAIGEVDIMENNKGMVDTVFRSFKWTAKQIVEEFGYDNVPEEVQTRYDDNSPEKFEIIHAIYPRNLDGMSKVKLATPKGYPIASKYVFKKEKKILRESGFHEMPTMVVRWSKIPGESYGRGPMMKALADVKMINKMMETTIRSGQLQMAPPLQVPDDGFLLPIKTTPHGLNFYRSGTQDRIEPINTGSRVDFGYQLLEKIQQQIKEAFYVDQLQLNENGPQMTATEVNARMEQKLRLLGPVLGRQNFELLSQMIARIFGILLRAGDIKIPPEVHQKLSKKTLSVRYSSLVARAQRVAEGANLSRFITAISPFVQADPSVADNLDGDFAVRYSGEIYGVPAPMLKDAEQVARVRKARSDAQAQQAQMQQQQHNADQMSKILPAIAQTKQAGIL